MIPLSQKSGRDTDWRWSYELEYFSAAAGDPCVWLPVGCLLLTLSNHYYANKMVNAIEAIPIQPALAGFHEMNFSTEAASMEQIQIPAQKTFRIQSLLAMSIIVLVGCALVYWLTGKAPAPLHQLDEQIRNRSAADLDTPRIS